MAVPAISLTPVNRIQSFPIDAQVRCHDKYVINFDFSEAGMFKLCSSFVYWQSSLVIAVLTPAAALRL